MKLYTNPLIVILTAPLIFVPWLVSQRAPAAHVVYRSPIAGFVSGTVSDVVPHGQSMMLVYRDQQQQVTHAVLGSGSHIVDKSDQSISVGTILPGDALVAQANGAIRDTSQAATELQGIVADSPGPDGTTLVLNIQNAQGIIVDIDHKTQVIAAVAGTPPLAAISDSDIVRVNGVYDRTAGEMVRTDSIVRVGP